MCFWVIFSSFRNNFHLYLERTSFSVNIRWLGLLLLDTIKFVAIAVEIYYFIVLKIGRSKIRSLIDQFLIKAFFLFFRWGFLSGSSNGTEIESKFLRTSRAQTPSQGPPPSLPSFKPSCLLLIWLILKYHHIELKHSTLGIWGW